MFKGLFDRARKVSENFEEEHGLGKGDLDSDLESDLDMSPDAEQATDTGFQEDLIAEMDLVSPKKKREEYDQEQLDMGISVEAEHTGNPQLAAVIAANHLDEIPDYYTRLKAMEEEAKEQGDTMGGEEGELSDLEGEAEEQMGESKVN